MNNEYQDKLLHCRECGADFIFSGKEQEFYAQKGFDHEPSRCLQCRNQKRRERNPVAAAPVANRNNYQPYSSNGANANNYAANQARPSNSPVRNGGISNGYRPNAYSNRTYGPNYSALGRSTSSFGNNYSRPNYTTNNSNGLNNRPVNNYNRPNYNQPEERKMYPIVCSRCGISTEVPFAPREATPVFCRMCYNSQKNGR